MTNDPSEQLQHFVPQLYLKGFASSEDAKSLWAFQKHTAGVGLQRIDEAAAALNFFSTQSESEFSKLESQFAATITGVRKAVRGGRDPLTTELRQGLGEFVVFQLLRSADMRSRLEAQWDHPTFVALRRQEGTADLGVAEYEQVLLEELPQMRDIAQWLANHVFVLGVNDTGQPTYTSDRPVVTLCQGPDPKVDFGDFILPTVRRPLPLGFQTVLPLRPDLILVVYDRDFYADEATLDGKVNSLTADGVSDFNSLQIIQSQHHVYCAGDDFDFARDFCSNHPEASIDRSATSP